jgi:hypothetical protein
MGRPVKPLLCSNRKFYLDIAERSRIPGSSEGEIPSLIRPKKEKSKNL